MLIFWDDAQETLRRMCQDSSIDGIAFQNLMANQGYGQLLEELGRQATEMTEYLTLEANRSSFQVAPDCVRPKTLVLIDGTTETPVIEEPSDLKWTALRSAQSTGKPNQYHYDPRFGVGGGILHLSPVPSSAYILKMIYEATERSLSQPKYTTGSVSLERGSDVVTGIGTNFNADMPGRYFQLTGDNGGRLPYRVREYLGSEELRLEQYYHGNTVTEKPYIIAEAFNLPTDCQMVPLFFAAWMWWSTKGNTVETDKFYKLWREGTRMAKKNHAVPAGDGIIRDNGYSLPFPDYPPNFPVSV